MEIQLVLSVSGVGRGLEWEKKQEEGGRQGGMKGQRREENR